MATVGMGNYASAAHTFFEGLRTFDAEAACKVLADDCWMKSPWAIEPVVGPEDIQAHLAEVLENPETRPSFTIRDITGDGSLVHFALSVSGRFGAAPERMRLSLLHLDGAVHQIRLGLPDAGHH